jgi:DNA-binding transcriptional ArsR family regulator
MSCHDAAFAEDHPSTRGMKDGDQLVGDILRALADPSRRAVFERIAYRELPVKGIVATLRISQPAVSNHPSVLRRAGLVAGRREGKCVYYIATPAGLRQLRRWIDARTGPVVADGTSRMNRSDSCSA